jgi:tRNA (uracil-5-)-methyltransferase TRM9
MVLDCYNLDMHADIADRLTKLNKQFYQTFAIQFAATRQRLQPGVMHILESIPPKAKILDLGCGNGELARQLVQSGHHGQYLGLDFSQELLDVARAGCPDTPKVHFAQADLSNPDWHSQFPIRVSQFTTIFAFAALHHLPGRELHLKTFQKIHTLLPAGGRFIHSNWQFLNSRRLKVRVQPWEVMGISRSQIDSGDYLLDWRRGGYGVRYVHQFDEAELEGLARETGFEVRESFTSDGQEGNLGLYQVWEKV